MWAGGARAGGDTAYPSQHNRWGEPDRECRPALSSLRVSDGPYAPPYRGLVVRRAPVCIVGGRSRSPTGTFSSSSNTNTEERIARGPLALLSVARSPPIRHKVVAKVTRAPAANSLTEIGDAGRDEALRDIEQPRGNFRGSFYSDQVLFHLHPIRGPYVHASEDYLT